MLEECRKLIEAGDFSEAELRLNAFLLADRENVEGATLLAIVFAKTGRWNEASERLEEAWERDPDHLEALTWLAAVRRTQNRPDDAIPLLLQVLEQRPDDLDALNLWGSCLLALGKAGEAETAFRRALGLQTNVAATYSNLGMTLRLQNRGEEALTAFRKALTLEPERASNYLQLFKQYQQLSRWEEAVETLQSGLKRHIGSVLLGEGLAVAYGRLGQAQRAENIFRNMSHVSASAANSYAAWLQEEGRFADSVPVLQQSLRLQPLQGAPYRSLVEAKQFVLDGKPILETVLGLLENPKLDEAARMHLHYALGKIHEHGGDFHSAMQAFDKANGIAYRTYPTCRTFDPVWTKREPELLSALYSQAFMERLAQKGSSDARPIFIVGMIRSGTTLLDQIVSSHPDVVSMGEGTFWNTEAPSIHPRWTNEEPEEAEIFSLAERYLGAVGAPQDSPRFTDKMPLNYRNLGLIHTVFPEARILHIRRNPLDTCLSIYATFLAGGANFLYRKENIVAFYRAYLRSMEHWRESLPKDRLFELDYESLVVDPEPLTRSILAFLDLPWDDVCLHPESNPSAVNTPSRWQARQPIYKTSMEKWRPYEPWLGEFEELRKDPALPAA